LFSPALIPFTPELFSKLRNNYDVIVCSEVFQWSTIFAVLAKIFSFKRKVKIIIWQEMAKHQRILARCPSLIFHRIILRFFLDRYITKYVPRGKLAMEFLLNQKIDENKITNPISHGIARSVFFCAPNIKKENYIFSPSRLVYEKGVDILLKAFAIAKKELNDVKLIIQGDGPKLEEYKNLSKKLSIDKDVIFCIDRTDHKAMRLKYQKALVTVIASRLDLVIFSVMESFACGTPVIISSGIDSHVNLLDQKGGMVFNNENYKQLASAMIKIIKDDAYRRDMERQALEKAQSYFNDYLYKRFGEIIYGIYNNDKTYINRSYFTFT